MKTVVCVGGCDYLVEGTWLPATRDIIEFDSGQMGSREALPERVEIDSVMLVTAIERGNALELIADLDMEFLNEVQTAFAVRARELMNKSLRDTIERFCETLKKQGPLPVFFDYPSLLKPIPTGQGPFQADLIVRAAPKGNG